MLFIASAFCPAIWIKAKIKMLPLPKRSTNGNCGPKLLNMAPKRWCFLATTKGLAMASILVTMASNLEAMVSNLEAMG